METTRDRGPDTERSCELIEMHLLDADAREEESLCGAEVSVLDLTTVQNYLECRRHISSLPTVCNDLQGCRRFTSPGCATLRWRTKE